MNKKESKHGIYKITAEGRDYFEVYACGVLREGMFTTLESAEASFAAESRESLAQHILGIDFPGRTMFDAEIEARNRMQTALEEMLFIKEDMKRLQYNLDHAEQDFARAQEAAVLFDTILKLES